MKLKLSSLTVFIFIIIVAIIVMTPDVTKALLIILLVIQMASWVRKDNQISLSLQEKPMKVMSNPALIAPAPAMRKIIPVESPPQFNPSGLGGPNNLDLYGIYYDKWNNQRSAYTNSYNEPRPRVGTSCAERNYSVDSANTIDCQKRTRDKQRNDGWAAKSADYFAYHYADELDIEEHKRWWGNDEF